MFRAGLGTCPDALRVICTPRHLTLNQIASKAFQHTRLRRNRNPHYRFVPNALSESEYTAIRHSQNTDFDKRGLYVVLRDFSISITIVLENPVTKPGRFLTAEWRYLAMINYEIDPALLIRYRPRGTELDDWKGKTFVSVVGFLFQKTRIFGLSIPFHRNFEEINLRFYVRYRAAEGWRRGVVFIKEIVPRRAIATAARLFYNENYAARKMAHRIDCDGSVLSIEYSWRESDVWNGLKLMTAGEAKPLVSGSEEEFISEHYWGYSAQTDGGCVEYKVEHPPWRVWQVDYSRFDCDVEGVYGRQFVEYLQAQQTSAFVADGSAVTVSRGVRL